jgi:molecular chaperone DnaK
MINIVAIGFGEADRSFLKQIATIEEGAMYTTLSNLGKTINTIATAIIDSPTGLVEHFR